MADRTITGRNRAGSGSVVHDAGCPRGIAAGMTGVALCGGWHMDVGLGQCIGKVIAAVVAGAALPRGANVIHLCGRKQRDIGMTGVTLHGGGDMRGGFADRRNIVMAIGAATVYRGRNRCMVGL